MDRSELIASVVALRALGYDVTATPRGVLVTSVAPDAPAAKMLEEGDVIVAVDGVTVRTPAQLRREVGRREPGDELELEIRREEDGGREDPCAPSRALATTRSPIIGILVDQDAQIELPFEVDIDLGKVGGPSAGLPFALEIARQLGRDVTHGLPDRGDGSARARRHRRPDRRNQAEDDRRGPRGCGFLPRPGRRERRGSASARGRRSSHPC